eukprot:7294952-Pyramimonas_sp.AAC.1
MSKEVSGSKTALIPGVALLRHGSGHAYCAPTGVPGACKASPPASSMSRLSCSRRFHALNATFAMTFSAPHATFWITSRG